MMLKEVLLGPLRNVKRLALCSVLLAVPVLNITILSYLARIGAQRSSVLPEINIRQLFKEGIFLFVIYTIFFLPVTLSWLALKWYFSWTIIILAVFLFLTGMYLVPVASFNYSSTKSLKSAFSLTVLRASLKRNYALFWLSAGLLQLSFTFFSAPFLIALSLFYIGFLISVIVQFYTLVIMWTLYGEGYFS